MSAERNLRSALGRALKSLGYTNPAALSQMRLEVIKRLQSANAADLLNNSWSLGVWEAYLTLLDETLRSQPSYSPAIHLVGSEIDMARMHLLAGRMAGAYYELSEAVEHANNLPDVSMNLFVHLRRLLTRTGHLLDAQVRSTDEPYELGLWLHKFGLYAYAIDAFIRYESMPGLSPLQRGSLNLHLGECYIARQEADPSISEELIIETLASAVIYLEREDPALYAQAQSLLDRFASN